MSQELINTLAFWLASTLIIGGTLWLLFIHDDRPPLT